jgi:peptidoglycan/LPS O-acetylase OafA/YrhL
MGVFRLLLAVTVVIGHAWGQGDHHAPGTMRFFGLLNPYYSVQLFFVVSGFYMALVLDTKYSKHANGTRLFYVNRVARLLPSYLAVLFTYGLIVYCLRRANSTPNFGWWGHYRTLFGSHHRFAFVSLILSNLGLVGLDIAPFFSIKGVAGHNYVVIPPAWSIGMELCFYLLAPWLVRRSLKTLLALVGLAALIRIGILCSPLPFVPWHQRFFFTECGFFVLGILSYKFIYRAIADAGWHGLSGWKKTAMTGYVLASFGIVLFVTCLGNITLWFERAWLSFVQSVYLGLITALIIPGLFAWTRRSRLDQFLGDLCYPLYLAHFPVIYLFGKEIYGKNFGINILVLSILPTLVLVYLIERPLDRWRKSVLQAPVQSPGQPRSALQLAA